FNVSFSCAPENVDKLIALVYKEINKIKNGKYLKEDLKKVIKIKRREREVALEKNSFWLSLLVGSYQSNMDPEKLFNTFEDRMKTLTPEQMVQTAKKYLNTENVIQVVLKPKGSK